MRFYAHQMIRIETKDKLNSGTVKTFFLNYSFDVIIANVNGGVLQATGEFVNRLCLTRDWIAA